MHSLNSSYPVLWIANQFDFDHQRALKTLDLSPDMYAEFVRRIGRVVDITHRISHLEIRNAVEKAVRARSHEFYRELHEEAMALKNLRQRIVILSLIDI